MKLALFFILIVLISCSSPEKKKPDPRLKLFQLEDYGGLSGLFIEYENKEEIVFWTHTDRGPNGKESEDKKNGWQRRPFLDPSFHPFLLRFSLNLKDDSIKILETIELPLSGLPNKNGDEMPYTTDGKIIERDLFGIDPESICIMDGYIWMGEEYGPSLVKFSLQGKFLNRYVPKNSFDSAELKKGGGIIKDSLPEILRRRKLNRGFEGIACENGKVFAVLQSPLPNEKNNVRILEFNPSTEKVENEFLYPLDPSTDKIGDLTVKDHKFYIIEQNSLEGEKSFHKVFSFNLEKEIKKEFVLDLVKIGFDFADKIEGLSLSKDSIYFLNDNDFGLTGELDKSGKPVIDEKRISILGSFKQN